MREEASNLMGLSENIHTYDSESNMGLSNGWDKDLQELTDTSSAEYCK